MNRARRIAMQANDPERYAAYLASRVKHRAEHLAERLEYERAWRAANRDSARRAREKYATKLDPAYHREWRRSTEEHRARDRARKAASNAIQAGRLVKQPCEVCGDPNVHAHHDDYAKPLEVRWLCPPHHGQAHWRDA